MITCVLCNEETDAENPLMTGAVYALNPNTLRMSWMHGWCYLNAVEDSSALQSTSSECEDRYDQWVHHEGKDR